MNGSLQYPANNITNYASFDQAASAEQMALSQYNANGQMNYQNMFQGLHIIDNYDNTDPFVDDTPVVTPRNPWTAAENTPIMPAQQQKTQQQCNVPPALSPFQNAVDPNMYLNGGGNSANANLPPVSLPQPMSAPKLNPGVIGDRAMTRHNSVSSSVGSNLYDMMLRNNGPGSIFGDPRVSCSPPLPGMHTNTTTNGGSSGLGRSTCDSATQTEDNLAGFDISVCLCLVLYAYLLIQRVLAPSWDQ